MQILLVVGITWSGIAARQGGTHIWFWLTALLFFFIPQAAVVGWCAQVWPIEGGVYQWTKYALGPFAGFMSAWNFGVWALLAISNIGILTATSLSYGLGPRAAWMEDSHALIAALTVGLFGVILLINLPGFGIGRWVAHFGTAVTVLVTLLLMALLFIHPHASKAHPHVNPQAPFSFAMPALTLFSVNLFSKIAFNALSGLEQVAVFAGETRNAGRAIMRSAWIAAPLIGLIYVLMAGAMLAYTPAAKVDLTGPIPQILAAAFGGGSAGAGTDWGLVLGRATILVLAVALVAQFAVIVAETSRLPMVAGWDRMIPAWFTRLDPRWKTPTRSIAVIVALSIFFRTAGDVWDRRAGGVSGDYVCWESCVRNLLPDDVCHPSGGREAVRGESRNVVESGCALRHCGDAAGDGIQLAADRRCAQQVGVRRQSGCARAVVKPGGDGGLLERDTAAKVAIFRRPPECFSYTRRDCGWGP
jgi:amino acid transporter